MPASELAAVDMTPPQCAQDIFIPYERREPIVRRQKCRRADSLASSVRPEIQDVSVQVANTELAPSVRRVIDVGHKLNRHMSSRITGKSSLRGFNLARLEDLIKIIHLGGVKP